MSDWAPVDTITARARAAGSASAPLSTQSRRGRWEKSTRVTFSVRSSAPNRAAWARNAVHQLGAQYPVREAGIVLHVGRDHELPAGLVAGGGGLSLEDQRRQVGAGAVDGGGQAGRARADDDDVVDR